jgi:hypothetical protein
LNVSNVGAERTEISREFQSLGAAMLKALSAVTVREKGTSSRSPEEERKDLEDERTESSSAKYLGVPRFRAL